MRLIDADVLNNFIDKWLSKKCDEHGNTTPNEWLNSLKRCVEEQPTAYEVDNVIKRLNTLKNEYEERRKNTYCRVTETDSCDSCRADHYLDARIGAVDRSIEIVKQGGVSGDVCEWKLDGVYLHSPHKPLVSCVTDENYRYYYCPVCGKKIKAVE